MRSLVPWPLCRGPNNQFDPFHLAKMKNNCPRLGHIKLCNQMIIRVSHSLQHFFESSLVWFKSIVLFNRKDIRYNHKSNCIICVLYFLMWTLCVCTAYKICIFTDGFSEDCPVTIWLLLQKKKKIPQMDP